MNIHNIIDFFNNITKNCDRYIKNNSIHLRQQKNKISDCLMYRFLYRFNDATQNKVVSKINDNNIKNINNGDINKKYSYIKRSSLITKTSHISLVVYEDMLEHVSSFYKNNTPNSIYSIFNVDGVNGNVKYKNGFYEETMTMGYFDQTKDIPFTMEYKGLGDHKDEINKLKEFVKENKFSDNSIVVCDRAYGDYNFYNLLDDSKLGYVIRLKSNCPLLTNREPSKYTTYFEDYTKIKNNKNIRIITYDNKRKNTIVNSIKNVDIIDEISTFSIITNLDPVIFPNEKIKEIYRSRWLIELYFKYVKKNFKFDCMECNNEDEIKKNIIIDMIMYYFMKIIEVLNNDKVKNTSKVIISRKKEIIEVYTKFDRTTIIDGFKNTLLNHIFYSTVDEIQMNHFNNNYVFINKNKYNRFYPRTCKNPTKKWHTKQFQNKQRYVSKLKNDEIKNTKKINNKIYDTIDEINNISEFNNINDSQKNSINATLDSLKKIVINENSYFLVILKKFRDYSNKQSDLII